MLTRKRAREPETLPKPVPAEVAGVGAGVVADAEGDADALQLDGSFTRELQSLCDAVEYFLKHEVRQDAVFGTVLSMRFKVPGCEGVLTFKISEARFKRGFCSVFEGAEVSTESLLDFLRVNVRATVEHWVQAMANADPGTAINTRTVSESRLPGGGVVVATGRGQLVLLTTFNTAMTTELFKGTKQDREVAGVSFLKEAAPARGRSTK